MKGDYSANEYEMELVASREDHILSHGTYTAIWAGNITPNGREPYVLVTQYMEDLKFNIIPESEKDIRISLLRPSYIPYASDIRLSREVLDWFHLTMRQVWFDVVRITELVQHHLGNEEYTFPPRTIDSCPDYSFLTIRR